MRLRACLDMATNLAPDYIYQGLQQEGPGDFGSYVIGFDQRTDGAGWNHMSAQTRENIWNAYIADKTNAFNAQQAELAWQRDRQLIQEQNEYNSPLNQMARYQEAGLNPAVIYGQIGNGNQTGAAEFHPSQAKAPQMVGDPRGTKEQNWQMALDGISALSGVLQQALGAAGAYEGVKNQNLQNQLLEAQLPFEKAVADYRHRYFEHPSNYQTSGVDENGNPTSTTTMFPGEITNIAFPKLAASDASGARSAYQKWWLEKIAPDYERLTGSKANQAATLDQLQQYNKEMLETLPPAARAIFSLFMEIAKLF